MREDFQVTREGFDRLLEWLASDRERAGEIYEEIRAGLIRFFRYRGCDEPETLADETINRVTRKLSTFTFNENVKKITYFYSFASKIYLEHLSKTRRRGTVTELEPSLAVVSSPDLTDEKERQFRCLERCLMELPADERNLVVRYYSKEKTAKLELRRKLAEEMNLKPNTLHTRVHRIRMVLRECIEKCLDEKTV